jgi:RHS repeat-associated protein
MSLTATQGASSWRLDYLYDEDGTPYGAVYRSPATSTSPTYFTTVTNERGDVCELLDANGNAFAAYHYDAWGLPQGAGNYATGIWTASTSLVNSTLAGQIAGRQVLRYAHYVYDSESGLYYCSARYCDPATRQFTTADSAKADGEESTYQYCTGNPVEKSDVSGYAPMPPEYRYHSREIHLSRAWHAVSHVFAAFGRSELRVSRSNGVMYRSINHAVAHAVRHSFSNFGQSQLDHSRSTRSAYNSGWHATRAAVHSTWHATWHASRAAGHHAYQRFRRGLDESGRAMGAGPLKDGGYINGDGHGEGSKK